MVSIIENAKGVKRSPDSSLIQIVWFKRDLRVVDHEPLACAALRGLVLPLYIVEPELWTQPDMSLRQWSFVRESLLDLNEVLVQLGQPLVVCLGEALEVFCELLDKYRVAAVWSHQETGNGWTFQRDQAIAKLLRQDSIPWFQPRQHGVVRGQGDRDQWSKQWERLMMVEPFATPLEERQQRQCNVRIGRDYPAPIVDHEEAARHARQRIQKARHSDEVREQSRNILARHGSRKRPRRRVRSKLHKPESLENGA